MIGDNLYKTLLNNQLAVSKIGELAQLAYEAYKIAATSVEEGTQDELTLKYPIGQDLAGETMMGQITYKKPDLIQHYVYLADFALPQSAIYQLVTLTEAMLGDIVRTIIRAYPKKLSGKRTVSISMVLSCETLESVHLAAVDSLLNELSYKSPRDFAEEIGKIIQCNLLEIPAYHRFIEVKATRDIHIHNRGIANDVYVSKSGTHARVASGQHLPINNNYFLTAYEACFQVIETLIDELHKHWPSPEYEDFKKKRVLEAEKKQLGDTSEAT